jgi:hypothetical protein
MRLVNLDQYRSREVVAALEELLEAAKQGEIRGLAYIVKVAPDDNRAGVVGEYKRSPAKALQATFQLERLLANTGPFAGSG